jgi:uncharacterized protein (AIM24 family)
MADVRRLIDQFKYQGVMTREDYDSIIKMVQEDGMVDKEEGEQLQRLFGYVNSGEIKVTEEKAEADQIAQKNRQDMARKYAPPTKQSGKAPVKPATAPSEPLTLDSVMSDKKSGASKGRPQRLTAADMIKEDLPAEAKHANDLSLGDENAPAEGHATGYTVDEPEVQDDYSSRSFREGGVLGQTQSEDGYSGIADLTLSAEGSPSFELASSRFLKVNLRDTIWMKVGAMVAYSGSVRFTRESVFEHGIAKMLKKSFTGEGTDLTRATGAGSLYLADHGKMITVYQLRGDTIVVNGNDLFAFENTVSWDITSMKRLAAMWAGGLFNVTLSGSGMVAITTHFDPVRIKVRPGRPVYTDPNATVAWSGTLKPSVKSDISMQTMIGRTSGETFQLCFEGEGDLLIQPFQEGVSTHSLESG